MTWREGEREGGPPRPSAEAAALAPVFRHLRAVASQPGLWLHPDADTWSGGLPAAETSAPVSGRHRGGIVRAEAGGLSVLIKRPRRGGLLRSMLPDAFFSARRSVREALALERLSALGLAPRCLGLQVEGALLVRPRLAIEIVPGALDLLEHARIGVADARGLAVAAGRAVRAMHGAGVSHPDLNAANIIARRDAGGWRAWIVDLDGAGVGEGAVADGARVSEVLRLCRSLDKWEPSSRTAAEVRSAFLKAALGPPLARLAWRSARRRFAWRRALGRVPRPL